MLKLIKNRGRDIFITEAAIIKENIIKAFNFNKIECRDAPVSFWASPTENVTKMMLFVS